MTDFKRVFDDTEPIIYFLKTAPYYIHELYDDVI